MYSAIINVYLPLCKFHIILMLLQYLKVLPQFKYVCTFDYQVLKNIFQPEV